MRLFDLHCDTLYRCFQEKQNLAVNDGQLDFIRGLQYEAWFQVMAVWMPDELRGEAAVRQCRQILTFGKEQLRAYPKLALEIQTADDMETALTEHRCGVLFAVEGGSALGGDLSRLAELKKFGVKLITLTWNGSNELGNGVGAKDSSGLTPLGKQVVQQLKQEGMFPDVSHLNRAGFWDVMTLADGPVLATHSVCAAVQPHPRNLDDDQFRALRACGGLVGLNVCEAQLGEQSLERVEAHLYHYWELGGERTVALGLDLDGTELRADWKDVSVAGRLYEFLQRKGYKESLLERLFFGNSFDFFQTTLTRKAD